jgi:hypothetical protein
MLTHQLPALPPLPPLLDELPVLFAWLDGEVQEVAASVIAFGRDEDQSWSPPKTVATWRAGVPLEAVRFAAANHLLVELDYGGRTRVIEPYSLRRTRAGNLILHAERADGSGHRPIESSGSKDCARQRCHFAPVSRSSSLPKGLSTHHRSTGPSSLQLARHDQGRLA